MRFQSIKNSRMLPCLPFPLLYKCPYSFNSIMKLIGGEPPPVDSVHLNKLCDKFCNVFIVGSGNNFLLF